MHNEKNSSADFSRPGAVIMTKPTIDTPLSRVNEARANMHSLLNRIEALVDTLIGPVPASCDDSGARDNCDGVLNEIAGQADTISVLTSRAHAALDRLNGSLR